MDVTRAAGDLAATANRLARSLAVQGQKVVTGAHVRVYRLTNGAVGGRFLRAQNVLLTTAGRRSGQPRVTPLTATRVGDDVVLVASNGGAAKHPDWYLNLVADPAVSLQIGGSTAPYRARVATAEERPELWAAVTRTYQGYDAYQRRTEREIPLVVCSPVSPTHPGT